DGTIWGGEFLIGNLENFKRIKHFEAVSMPGGDKAIQQPWRMAVSYLYQSFGEDWLRLDIPFVQKVKEMKIDTKALNLLLGNNKLSLMTSSAGRLFDAVSSLLGLCYESDYHAEAPMRLQNLITAVKGENEAYSFIHGNYISFMDTIQQIVEDIQKGVDLATISLKFHNAVIQAVVETVKTIVCQYKITKVALSGGVFQNKYLLQKITDKLQQSGCIVYTNIAVPVNDGGLALGQLAIAAKRNVSKDNKNKLKNKSHVLECTSEDNKN
ncbi:MAG: hypothetical protein MI922_10005, partial [Bacteroidales bacterium]|nr:hypothetical protein [Bacteroidales bacterium]